MLRNIIELTDRAYLRYTKQGTQKPGHGDHDPDSLWRFVSTDWVNDHTASV